MEDSNVVFRSQISSISDSFSFPWPSTASWWWLVRTWQVSELTYCLWRSMCVLLLYRRAQHRSCLWAGQCPAPSGSLENPSPFWTHWKPSTCHLGDRGDERVSKGNKQEKSEKIHRLSSVCGCHRLILITYLWRKWIFHRPFRRQRWCLKANPSRSDWWSSGNQSAPCCFVRARTTCPTHRHTPHTHKHARTHTHRQHTRSIEARYIWNLLWKIEMGKIWHLNVFSL